MSLSHINDDHQPGMVDVSGKEATVRSATAEALVELPEAVLELFDDGELHGKKGPVFQTAILAGTMAAKKTAEWIPLCHPVGLDACEIAIRLNEDRLVEITGTAKVRHRTGVEMEALTAVSAAALTIYDMCKGVSQGIVIRRVRLLEKTGGKSDYRA